MTNTILTWTAPLVAMAALVGLWRSTNRSSRHAWRSLALVTALASASIMVLIALPGEAVLTYLLRGNSSATALMFGAGLWLAMSALMIDEYRDKRLVKRDVSDQTLWHEITHELTSDDSLDTMLLNIAGAFRRDADGACAHVFKISHSRRTAYRTGTVFSGHGFPGDHRYEHGTLLAELAWWAALERESAMVDGAGGTPILTLPISDGQTTFAIIMIENPAHAPHADWQPMAALIARTISDWSQLADYRDSGIIAQRMTAMLPTLMSGHRIEDALAVIDAALVGVVDYNYLSISSLGTSRAHEDRATTLSGSQRVIESRHRWPVIGATLQRVLSTGRAIITPDLDMAGDDDESDNTPWERRVGMRARLIAPVFDGRNVIGSITLAHRRYGRYSEHDTALIATVAAFLAPWMLQLDSTHRANRTDRALSFLRKLEGSVFATVDDKSLVDDASTILDATGMRVYRIDDDSESLVEVASAGRLPSGDSPRQVPLSSLPWHRLALASRRTMSIDQGDPESVMGGAEAALAMDPKMKTGCLVPIIGDGRSMGVIDVVERRHPDRNVLDNHSKLVVENLASTLGQRWSGSSAKSEVPINSGVLTDRLKGWSRQVVNPLTSIIGSVELIRHKGQNMSAEMIKYLGTIERSATRIHESLAGILTEAATADGEAPLSRWTSTRSTERARTELPEFARPASLAEAAMRQTEGAFGDSGPGMTIHNHSNIVG